MRGYLPRVLFLTAIVILFLWSLLAILLTGPVLTRVQPLELDLEVSTRRLEESVSILSTRFAPRDYLHPENLALAAEWITGRFRESGLSVEVQEYQLQGKIFRNVIASRAGTDPAAGAIIVGAHYDAFGPFAGANDNASGVAVLLELAQTRPVSGPPRFTQIYAAFCTEEPPYYGSDGMGSYVFAERLKQQNVAVELMIALDLVGYFSEAPRSQHFPHPLLRLLYPSRGNFIAVVGDLRAGSWIKRVKHGMLSVQALPVESFRAPAWLAPIHFSDHYSFRRLGLPGVLITDTAFMRYPYYHTAEDTPEKLDYERMGQLVRALHGVLYEGHPGGSAAD